MSAPFGQETEIREFKKSTSESVVIFKDRVEIYNPGTFPDGLEPKDYIDGEERSIKRNPLLAQLLYYSKDIESFGTGLKRIAKTCSEAGVIVHFKTLKSGVSVVFQRSEAEDLEFITESADRNAEDADRNAEDADRNAESADKALASADRIMKFVMHNGKITNYEGRVLTTLSATRVKEILKELCSQGLLNAHGANRSRYYTLP